MPAGPTAHLWIWLVATVGHFILTARSLRRIGPGASRDEQWFEVMLCGTAGLLFVLHVTAVLAGLTLSTGVVGLALWHGVQAWWLRGRVAAADAARPEGSALVPVRWLESAALVVFCCIAWHWLDRASVSIAVTGTDAAHYHVPVAVNLAQGASLFDLPPTQHLYPMATSMLAAWFIVPFGDALLVDLTTLVPFLLLAVSMAHLFRTVTGASGLAWTTWLTLALFSTPMFRSSSLMSADLLFTAAFMALVAQVTSLWSTRTWRGLDVLMLGCAAGLLLGSKTTGLLAVVLVLGYYGAAALARNGFRVPRPGSGQIGAAMAAASLAFGAGGIWLLRNWVLFGSPIAPNGLTLFGITVFPGEPIGPTTYLSVLESLQKDPTYSLASRAAHFVNQWFGAWYLPAVAVAGLVPVDALVAWWRGGARGLAATRLWLCGLLAATSVTMVWVLVGAPWTSLEWTHGFALRYILPLLALAPLMAFVGVFPLAFPWHTRPVPAALGGATLAVAGIVMLVVAERRDAALFVPGLTGSVLVGASLYLAAFVIARLEPRLAVGTAVIAVIAILPWISMVVTSRDVRARGAVAVESAAVSPAREVYEMAIQSETRAGRSCGRRRFFVLTRLDDPLSLEDVEYRNVVHYAAREVRLSARYAPAGPCDYIITSRPMMATEKGKALVAALDPAAQSVEIGEARPYLLLGAR